MSKEGLDSLCLLNYGLPLTFQTSSRSWKRQSVSVCPSVLYACGKKEVGENGTIHHSNGPFLCTFPTCLCFIRSKVFSTRKSSWVTSRENRRFALTKVRDFILIESLAFYINTQLGTREAFLCFFVFSFSPLQSIVYCLFTGCGLQLHAKQQG